MPEKEEEYQRFVEFAAFSAACNDDEYANFYGVCKAGEETYLGSSSSNCSAGVSGLIIIYGQA